MSKRSLLWAVLVGLALTVFVISVMAGDEMPPSGHGILRALVPA